MASRRDWPSRNDGSGAIGGRPSAIFERYRLTCAAERMTHIQSLISLTVAVCTIELSTATVATRSSVSMPRRQHFEVDAQTMPEGHGGKISAQQAAKHAHHGIAIEAFATGLVHALAPSAAGTEAEHADARADVTVQGAPETSQVAPSILLAKDMSSATMRLLCGSSATIENSTCGDCSLRAGCLGSGQPGSQPAEMGFDRCECSATDASC